MVLDRCRPQIHSAPTLVYEPMPRRYPMRSSLVLIAALTACTADKKSDERPPADSRSTGGDSARDPGDAAPGGDGAAGGDSAPPPGDSAPPPGDSAAPAGDSDVPG